MEKKDTDALQAELSHLTSAERSGVKLESRQLARRKAIQQVLKDQKDKAPTPVQKELAADQQQDPSSLYANPQLSVYYHPVLNPFGAPPPGARPMFHPVDAPIMGFHGDHNLAHAMSSVTTNARTPSAPQLEPLSLPLQDVPLAPPHVGLDRLYSYQGPRPSAPGATKAEQLQVDTRAISVEQENNQISDSVVTAETASDLSTLLADYGTPEGAAPLPFHAGLEAPELSPALIAMVPASVKRRKLQGTVADEEKKSIAQESSHVMAQQEDYEKWVRDMEALGAV